MPVVVPLVWSTGSPSVHVNCCGLNACRKRGAVGAPSRIANPPSLSRSNENVLCSPQCTQSRSPSADRSTVAGTSPRVTTIDPESAGGRGLGRAVLGVGRGFVDADEEG